MTYAVLLVLCIVFLELFLFFRLRDDVMTIFRRSREALRVFMAKDLDDSEKETFMRRESVLMLKAAGSFTAKFAIIFGVLYLVYLLAVSAFPDLRDEILDSLVSPAVIVILTVATLCYAWARNAIRKQL
jgi:hypothetical protein